MALLSVELGVGELLAGGLDGAVLVDGVALVDGMGGFVVGDLLGVGVVLVGPGAGLSWVQATGPTIHAATNRAVMTGRRTVLLV
ncbi:hypothetical protein [Streptomyces kaempferi]|uniref:Uncharacterized protein n=1 Tax=Streptomyces kaempferi TaxID=333725 RepID=A0ABW3XI14_9ACTN